MNFANPFILSALAAVTIPVMIHLFTRKKPQKVVLPTMILLLEKNRKDHFIRIYRLREFLLLLLRMLVIMLVVLFFAGIIIPSSEKNGKLNVHEDSDLVLVIDTSASMGYKDGSLSPIEHSLRKIRKLLKKKKFQSYSLYTHDNRLNEKLLSSTNVNELKQCLDKIKPTLFKADINKGISMLGNRLKAIKLKRPAILVFTDMQKNSLKSVNTVGDLFCPGFESLEIVDMANPRPGNCYISNWECRKEGKDILNLTFTVRNGGETEQRWDVALFDKNSKRPMQSWSGVLQRGEEKSCQFNLPYNKGSWYGNLSLSGDFFLPDNKVYIAYTPPETGRILLIGKTSQVTEMKFVETVLETLAVKGKAVETISIPVNKMDQKSISGCKLIVLQGPEAVKNKYISEWIKSGGAAIVFSGKNKNRKWSIGSFSSSGTIADKKGLAMVRGDTTGPYEEPYWFDSRKEDPLKFVSLCKLNFPVGTKVFSRFKNSIPAILEVPHGKGKIVFMNFACDSLEHGLVKRPEFVMLLSRTVESLIDFTTNNLTPVYSPASPIVMKCSDLDGKCSIETPEKNSMIVLPGEDGLVRLPGFNVPGHYRIANDNKSKEKFIVINFDCEESDFSRKPLKKYAMEIPRTSRQSSWSSEISEKKYIRITTSLLIAALFLLLIEMFLERKYHG